MPLGTLRDALIYPHTHSDMLTQVNPATQRQFSILMFLCIKGRTDAELSEIMEQVSLQEVWAREGGWDAVNDWIGTHCVALCTRTLYRWSQRS
jgi:ABC-type uncharacterized transport system fused permease/ATPase subunit